jgi:hypothetical protein
MSRRHNYFVKLRTAISNETHIVNKYSLLPPRHDFLNQLIDAFVVPTNGALRGAPVAAAVSFNTRGFTNRPFTTSTNPTTKSISSLRDHLPRQDFLFLPQLYRITAALFVLFIK